MAMSFVMNQESTHMGAVAFGSKVHVLSELTSSKLNFVTAVAQFDYRGGMTNTTAALLRVRDMFITSKNDNSRLKRVLILITDGKSNANKRRPEEVARELARHSVETFVFGIAKVAKPELNDIASPPSDTHVFYVSHFSVFKEFSEAVTSSINAL